MKKKLECPSSQIYREDRNSGGSDHSTSGSASRVRSGRAYEKYCAVKEAKKAEIVTWLAAEIEVCSSICWKCAIYAGETSCTVSTTMMNSTSHWEFVFPSGRP